MLIRICLKPQHDGNVRIIAADSFSFFFSFLIFLIVFCFLIFLFVFCFLIFLFFIFLKANKEANKEANKTLKNYSNKVRSEFHSKNVIVCLHTLLFLPSLSGESILEKVTKSPYKRE